MTQTGPGRRLRPHVVLLALAASGAALVAQTATAQPACYSVTIGGSAIKPSLPVLPAGANAPLRTSAGGPIPLWPPEAVAPAVPSVVSEPPAVVVPPQPPPVTYAQLPGHWQLDGPRYVWIRPDRTPRRVVERAVVPNQYAWRDGRWVFVPQHHVAP
ncbi:MAG: hypothetical protein ABI369_04900 [Acetobacteraceae bacterium]